MDAAAPSPPVALLAGLDEPGAAACLRRLGRDLHLLTAGAADEALRLLNVHPVAVLVLGAGIPAAEAVRFLARAEESPGAAERVNVVLAGGPDPSLFQDLIDRDRVFYWTAEPVAEDELIAIVRSAVHRYRSGAPMVNEARKREALHASRLLAAARSVASRHDAPGAARAAADAARDLVDADRAYCLIYEAETDSLVAGESGSADERRESAAVGLVSYVVRTGLPVTVQRLGLDPRFDREADDPHAVGQERFVASPVVGSDGEALAVVSAVRDAEGEPFSPDEIERLSRFAEQVASTFGQLKLARLEKAPTTPPGEALFREPAVEYHQEGLKSEGSLLRADPAWMRWTYRLLIAVSAAALIFSVVARVREYAAGPAVVRLGDRIEVTATTDGTVSEILVEPGREVAEGALLVRMYGAREAADLERIERETELQLIDRLRNPSDLAAERALVSLRAELELARSRLAEREVRSPTAGVVSDLRVRRGQRIVPGQALLSLAGQGGEPSVLAMLPGEFRPLLKPGMRLRLELQGYPYLYQHLTVTAVGEEVIGPTEARRYLGEEIGDAVPVTGAVVLVSARLPSLAFEFQGEDRRYHDGMWGRAEVRVRSERVLVALVPALRALFEDADV